MDGWISIHRKIKDNWIWEDKPFSKGQAWIDILLRVNHADNKILIGNQLIELKSGQTIWSILEMSKEWGWSKTKVSNFLKLLENENNISQKRTTKYTLITVEKWEMYQDSKQKSGIKTETKEKQKNTNNNDNKENKNNSRFTPPTFEEVLNYCKERNNSVNPNKFIDFYQSKGWLVGKTIMKDWKAAIRTWEGKDNKDNKGETNKPMIDKSTLGQRSSMWND